MNDKLSLDAYRGLAKRRDGPEDAPPAAASGAALESAARRLLPLGRGWAIAVNPKLAGALGLALLVWIFIVALVVTLL